MLVEIVQCKFYMTCIMVFTILLECREFHWETIQKLKIASIHQYTFKLQKRVEATEKIRMSAEDRYKTSPRFYLLQAVVFPLRKLLYNSVGSMYISKMAVLLDIVVNSPLATE